MQTSTAGVQPVDLSPLVTSAEVDGNSVTIPDANFLFHADFKRTGSDLTLTGQDGHRVVVPDYFKHEHLPTLFSGDGSALTGDVVEALAGSVAPNQYAQAGAPVQVDPLAIGRVAAVQGSATAIRNGVAVTLNTGDLVRKGDVIITGGSASLGVIFTDGTTFNLSANARMVLNEFVYSVGGSSNSALINLVQGSITFIAGDVAKSGDMRVGTPVASLGIRGTAVQVDIDVNSGETKLSVLVEPNGVVGSFNVYSLSGQLLGVVNNAGVLATVTPAGPLQAIFTETQKSPLELQQDLLIVQQVFQTQSVGQFILQQQPLNTAGNATGTQIITSPTEVSTRKLDVAVVTTPTDTTVISVQPQPAPPGSPPTVPFVEPELPPPPAAPEPPNPPPVIHVEHGGIHYWAWNTIGDVSPINGISFDDPNAGEGLVRVTFSMNDPDDALTAHNLAGSGVTVVSGNGESQITLEGTISDINAYIFQNNLAWNPDGHHNHELGYLKVEIDDNGAAPGGNIVTKFVWISEIFTPDFCGSDCIDLSGVNLSNVCLIDTGSGSDEVTTAWTHTGVPTLYDGGSGCDTIHLVFTPDQLAEILADHCLRDNLTSFVDDPGCNTLDLAGTSWNAGAQNFENADINIVTGFGSGLIYDINCLIPDPDFIIGCEGDDANLAGVGCGNHVIVGLGGDDKLVGNVNADALFGGAGNDILIGGLGNDILSGSTGNDVFKFTETCGGAANFGNDIIVDFHPGEDTIEISQSVFADFAALQNALTEDCDGNAVIAIDCNNSITLAGVSVDQVVAHQNDFHLVA